jgi:Fic family protein
MVTVVKKTIKGNAYYYLEHTTRINGRFAQKELYLGRTIPKDIERIKRQFLFKLDKAKWFDDFEKVRHNCTVELRLTPKSAREKELREFSVRFTYDTQRIEGSTLTLRETALLLGNKISPSGKPVVDSKEAEAHSRVFFEMLGLKSDLSQKLVQDWNWKLLKDTKPDVAGRIRRHGVRISGSRFVPPSPVEIQPMLNEFFSWYEGTKGEANPVELAALVHLKFVTIHPFSDGNGRIGRLMMNHVLHKHGYPMLNIEYKTRATYYGSLERSQVNKGERPFLTWLFRRYRREHHRFLVS